MAIYQRAKSILKRLKRDESGTAALSWAVSMTAIMGAMGAAMDFAVLANADAKAQAIADNTALAAAIYIKNHGRPPTGEGELIEGEHTAESLGYEYSSLVLGGAAGVKVEINYDDNAKEVRTRVSGYTNPILVQVLGVKDLDFDSVSVASYLNIEDKFPASIALVLDNSGSMQFDDKLAENVEWVTHEYSCDKWVDKGRWQYSRRQGRWVWVSNWVKEEKTCYHAPHKHGTRAAGAEIRLKGLKDSVLLFQNEMKSRLGVEDDTGRKTLRMGMLPYSSAVIAAGTQTMDWGYLDEGTDGGSTGIKGMKADGGTNSSPPMTDAEGWMTAENGKHTDEAKRTQTEDKDPLKFVIFMTDGQNSVGGWTFTPGISGQWHKETSPGYWSTSGAPQSGYEEGTLRRTADVETEQSCIRMKNDGVKIFTIGYALENFGDFRVNGWNNWEDDRIYPIGQEVQTAAYNLMTNCATSPEHFIKAADAAQLEAAFDEIQNAIVEELIRLKS